MTEVLTRLADRGETARRVKALCGQIFRYAISLDLCDRDSCNNEYVMNAVPAPVPRHYATLTGAAEIGALLRRINGYEQFRTRCALMLAALRERRGGSGKYVFPNLRPSGEPRAMSENTLHAALQSLGYVNDKGETTMTAHGFRAMTSTILNEHGFRPDIIENSSCTRRGTKCAPHTTALTTGMSVCR